MVEESAGYYRWKTDTVDIREAEDLEELLSRLDGEEDPGRTLLSLTLTGLLPAEGGPLLERLAQTLESRFFWGELREDDLRASPSDSGWIDALDSPLLRETARRIQSGDGPEAVRARALLELYSMVRRTDHASSAIECGTGAPFTDDLSVGPFSENQRHPRPERHGEILSL